MSWKKPCSEATVRMWIERGDGQGVGTDFVPFHTVRSSTRGRAHDYLGMITGRIQHNLSDLEYARSVLAEYAKGTIDIREQFALLPWEETQEIARQRHIRQPLFRGTNVPFVHTSDLVITRSGPHGPVNYVVSLKYHADIDLNTKDAKKLMEVKRTLQLLTIERAYWRARNTSWHLCTDRSLPWTMFYNLDLFRPTMMRRRCDYLNTRITEFARLFVSRWVSQPTYALNQLLEYTAERLKLSMYEAFTLCGRAVWTRALPMDLKSIEICHQCPVRLIQPQP